MAFVGGFVQRRGAVLRRSEQRTCGVRTRSRRGNAVVTMLTGVDALMAVGGLVAFSLSAALGANDVANSLGTSVGTGAVKVTQALAIGAAMEFAGAVLFGSTVTRTISSGVVVVTGSIPIGIFLLGMTSVLAGCTAWMAMATKYGLPVSSTHSVVGALVGLGIVSGWGVNKVALVNIVLSWLVSPVAGGLCAFSLYFLIKKLIIDAEQPARATRRYLPILTGVTLFVLSTFLLSKGRGASMDQIKLLTISSGVSLGGGGLAAALVLGIRSSQSLRREMGLPERKPRKVELTQAMETEKIFKVLQVLTACLLAFSHGSNDVSNAIGPFAAMYDVYVNGALSNAVETPPWVLVMGGLGISAGLGLFGKPVMETVGKKITKLVPTKGFCVELGTALTVLIASRFGLPVSTTHTLVGCIVALGLATGDKEALNLKVLGNIAASWLITLPVSAALTVICFVVFKPLVTSVVASSLMTAAL